MGDRGFRIETDAGEAIHSAGVVAATGSFGSPHLPDLLGQDTFTGRVLHVASYHRPEPYVGQRVVVVGAGDSAVQVGYDLAEVASVTLASRRPIAFLPQEIDGRDLHYWLKRTGFDDLPPEWLARLIPGALVTDTGRYRAAVESGRPDRRPMFTALEGEHVVWSDGTREAVDTIILATGYRPHLDYLRALGALKDGLPRHVGGISTTHPGLGYVGIEYQRSYASNTLRGVHRDAEYITPAIAAHIRDAGALLRA
jgi:putative flavoprotein involved in K+ transport